MLNLKVSIILAEKDIRSHNDRTGYKYSIEKKSAQSSVIEMVYLEVNVNSVEKAGVSKKASSRRRRAFTKPITYLVPRLELLLISADTTSSFRSSSMEFIHVFTTRLKILKMVWKPTLF